MSFFLKIGLLDLVRSLAIFLRFFKERTSGLSDLLSYLYLVFIPIVIFSSDSSVILFLTSGGYLALLLVMKMLVHLTGLHV